MTVYICGTGFQINRVGESGIVTQLHRSNTWMPLYGGVVKPNEALNLIWVCSCPGNIRIAIISVAVIENSSAHLRSFALGIRYITMVDPGIGVITVGGGAYKLNPIVFLNSP